MLENFLRNFSKGIYQFLLILIKSISKQFITKLLLLEEILGKYYLKFGLILSTICRNMVFNKTSKFLGNNLES